MSDKYKARIIMTVILELELTASNGNEAYSIVKEHEDLILSEHWQSYKASSVISKIKETGYTSNIQLAEIEEKTSGIRLG